MNKITTIAAISLIWFFPSKSPASPCAIAVQWTLFKLNQDKAPEPRSRPVNEQKKAEWASKQLVPEFFEKIGL